MALKVTLISQRQHKGENRVDSPVALLWWSAVLGSVSAGSVCVVYGLDANVVSNF